MSMMGRRYVRKTQILFTAEMNPLKHNFWSFLAITISVFQIQMILILIPLQNDHDGWGYAQNTTFYSERK